MGGTIPESVPPIAVVRGSKVVPHSGTDVVVTAVRRATVKHLRPMPHVGHAIASLRVFTPYFAVGCGAGAGAEPPVALPRFRRTSDPALPTPYLQVLHDLLRLFGPEALFDFRLQFVERLGVPLSTLIK